MEKIISFYDKDNRDVQEWLDSGWKVKQIISCSLINTIAMTGDRWHSEEGKGKVITHIILENV